jgi:hypothetical protein
MSGPIEVAVEGPAGRILVSDSLSYADARVGPNDVMVGASFAGVPTVALPLARGAKGIIAHDAGIGKDRAGVAGLALAERHGIAAAAVASMSARVSDGRSLYAGMISEANAPARRLGIAPGMTCEEAAQRMLEAPSGRPLDLHGAVDEAVHVLSESAEGRVLAVWSFMLLHEPHPRDVVCVASHAGRVMADYALLVSPRAVFANDAGGALDGSGVDGLAVLDQKGIPAAAVGTMSARIGDALSTYHDGMCSQVNATAAARGVRLRMSVVEAAQRLI